MKLTPDNPNLVELLIDEMEENEVFDFEDIEDIDLEIDIFTYPEE